MCSKKKCRVEYPFSEHACTLAPEKQAVFSVECGFFRRLFVRYCLVSEHDVRTHRVYRSYAAFRREQKRHYQLHPYTIHPLSMLRAYWEAYITLCYILYTIILPIRFAKFDERCSYGWILLIFDISTIIDFLLNFFSGYITGAITKTAVLDLKSIRTRYAKYILVDILPSAGLLSKYSVIGVRPILCLVALKTLRTFTLFKYTNNMIAMWNISIKKSVAINVLLLITVYIQLNMFFQFWTEYMAENSFNPVDPRECSWMSIINVWNRTRLDRYVNGFDRAVAMLRQNTNLNLTESNGCDENFMMIAWIISKLVFYHCLFKILVVATSSDSAASKYFRMKRQVETYVRLKKLPNGFKKKIVKYYAIRFQSKYFVESQIIGCVSGQLREDIIMHTANQLVKNVPVLQRMPRAMLMHVALRLKVEVFLSGDIIMKVNSIGDCLYFIDKGTVAMYSQAGHEVCHLQDGDFFGEIGMMMKVHFRITSAVAVTNCEVYRLDWKDFEVAVAAYPDVQDYVRKVALARAERAAVLDDQYRAQENTRDRRPSRTSQDYSEDLSL